jgi:hypothetical protein
VTRDKRGYENTFVVEAERRRGKSRPRILYWFRTPPGVRVGRTALDEQAVRLIEQQNPDLEFDWPRILKGQGSPVAEPRPPDIRDRGERRGRPDARRQPGQQRDRDRRPAPQADMPPRPRRESRPAPHPEVVATPSAAAPARPQPPELVETAEESTAVDVVEIAPATHLGTPAHARLGDEGVQRLRIRYVEILMGIQERVADAGRQTELKSSAERLNPDAWLTDADVVQGLEQYEVVLASLREVAGRKRRRRRRGGRGAAEVAPAPESSTDAAPDREPSGVGGEAPNAEDSGPDRSRGDDGPV